MKGSILYVATPHGSDKNATKFGKIDATSPKKVATPHGSDKNATQQQSEQRITKKSRVATPHGSDKNATLLLKSLKDKD